jgi:hypothetical protein
MRLRRYATAASRSVERTILSKLENELTTQFALEEAWITPEFRRLRNLEIQCLPAETSKFQKQKGKPAQRHQITGKFEPYD